MMLSKFIDLDSLLAGVCLLVVQASGVLEGILTPGVATALGLAGIPTTLQGWAHLAAWFVVYVALRIRDNNKRLQLERDQLQALAKKKDRAKKKRKLKAKTPAS